MLENDDQDTEKYSDGKISKHGGITLRAQTRTNGFIYPQDKQIGSQETLNLLGGDSFPDTITMSFDFARNTSVILHQGQPIEATSLEKILSNWMQINVGYPQLQPFCITKAYVPGKQYLRLDYFVSSALENLNELCQFWRNSQGPGLKVTIQRFIPSQELYRVHYRVGAGFKIYKYEQIYEEINLTQLFEKISKLTEREIDMQIQTFRAKNVKRLGGGERQSVICTGKLLQKQQILMQYILDFEKCPEFDLFDNFYGYQQNLKNYIFEMKNQQKYKKEKLKYATEKRQQIVKNIEQCQFLTQKIVKQLKKQDKSQMYIKSIEIDKIICDFIPDSLDNKLILLQISNISQSEQYLLNPDYMRDPAKDQKFQQKVDILLKELEQGVVEDPAKKDKILEKDAQRFIHSKTELPVKIKTISKKSSIDLKLSEDSFKTETKSIAENIIEKTRKEIKNELIIKFEEKLLQMQQQFQESLEKIIPQLPEKVDLVQVKKELIEGFKEMLQKEIKKKQQEESLQTNNFLMPQSMKQKAQLLQTRRPSLPNIRMTLQANEGLALQGLNSQLAKENSQNNILRRKSISHMVQDQLSRKQSSQEQHSPTVPILPNSPLGLLPSLRKSSSQINQSLPLPFPNNQYYTLPKLILSPPKKPDEDLPPKSAFNSYKFGITQAPEEQTKSPIKPPSKRESGVTFKNREGQNKSESLKSASEESAKSEMEVNIKSQSNQIGIHIKNEKARKSSVYSATDQQLEKIETHKTKDNISQKSQNMENSLLEIGPIQSVSVNDQLKMVMDPCSSMSSSHNLTSGTDTMRTKQQFQLKKQVFKPIALPRESCSGNSSMQSGKRSDSNIRVANTFQKQMSQKSYYSNKSRKSLRSNRSRKTNGSLLRSWISGQDISRPSSLESEDFKLSDSKCPLKIKRPKLRLARVNSTQFQYRKSKLQNLIQPKKKLSYDSKENSKILQNLLLEIHTPKFKQKQLQRFQKKFSNSQTYVNFPTEKIQSECSSQSALKKDKTQSSDVKKSEFDEFQAKIEKKVMSKHNKKALVMRLSMNGMPSINVSMIDHERMHQSSTSVGDLIKQFQKKENQTNETDNFKNLLPKISEIIEGLQQPRVLTEEELKRMTIDLDTHQIFEESKEYSDSTHRKLRQETDLISSSCAETNTSQQFEFVNQSLL